MTVMNPCEKYSGVLHFSRHSSGPKGLCYVPLSLLQAALRRWEPERPELLIRLRPRHRDGSRNAAR
jgi:hypothetical protein